MDLKLNDWRPGNQSTTLVLRARKQLELESLVLETLQKDGTFPANAVAAAAHVDVVAQIQGTPAEIFEQVDRLENNGWKFKIAQLDATQFALEAMQLAQNELLKDIDEKMARRMDEWLGKMPNLDEKKEARDG